MRKRLVADRAARAVQKQQARSVALFGRVLGDQVLGKEIGIILPLDHHHRIITRIDEKVQLML